jgi:hypothetical protein
MAVLEVMAARTACLGTGHLGPEEVVALFREAKRLKIERRVMTHAEAPLVGGSFDLQVRMAKEGCFVERSYLSAYHQQGGYPIEKTAAELKRLGPERVVLETDLGQATNPSPIAGLNRYCEQLHGLGVPESALRRMVGDNPAWLLNLPPR